MKALKINGKDCVARAGETVLDVARREGFFIPTLCHHEMLKPYGACRVCLVEVSRGGRSSHIATACTHPALDGLTVTLETEAVKRTRRIVLELLLAHAPDAPKIKAYAQDHGVETSRFDRVDEPRDCILCGLCERVCRDVVGACAISLAGRGGTRRAEPPFADEQSCIGCGACEALCPTGVLEMQKAASNRFRELAGEDRQCRYALMGLLPTALCANDYRCERCETEQTIMDRFGCHPLLFAHTGSESEVL